MEQPYKKRLNKDEYSRPKLTYTDKLTAEEIETLLDDYKKVDDIYQVPMGTHMRYFLVKNGVKKFRTGGILSNSTGLPKYVVLSNGTKTWSVQTKDTVFFKKMTLNEIKGDYEDIIDDLEKKVSDLEKKNTELRNYILHLKKNNKIN
ncbi:MAG: hypothetical protein Homavirus15_7 [Homavirus sp.]|uniref:Uncharacterized protein n=1 Tax=Homavirus sp. TaxID=2487769 RepID=A0A3G5A4Q0_9VIRU|nr:MAG: hypothetical protein Homavirus15_7 [Homavirus sp.]